MGRTSVLVLGLCVAAVACAEGPGAPLQSAAGEAPDNPFAPSAPSTPSPVLPLVFLDTDDGFRPQGTFGHVEIVEDHDGTLGNLVDLPLTLWSRVGFRVRGNSSARFPKQSYTVDLRDDGGYDRPMPVLGMPADSEWVLYACYADKTCLRNALVYTWGQALGRWTPRWRFVEAFLDGRYQGLYMAVEKIKVAPDRVNLPAPAVDAVTGDITGGYILKREAYGEGGGHDFWSMQGTLWTFDTPRTADLTPAQRKYIVDHVNKVEAVLAGPLFADPIRGYRAWIDVPSWVDFALIQEATHNVDGYRRSVYAQKQSRAAGGLMVMGPLWDFDIALGNADYANGFRTDGWAFTPRDMPDPIGFFWGRLWTDAAFQRDLRCRWQDLRKGVLAMPAIDARIDEWVRLIARAGARDHQRWPILGRKVWPNWFVGAAHSDEVAFLRHWIAQRLQFLDANLPGTCPGG